MLSSEREMQLVGLLITITPSHTYSLLSPTHPSTHSSAHPPLSLGAVAVYDQMMADEAAPDRMTFHLAAIAYLMLVFNITMATPTTPHSSTTEHTRGHQGSHLSHSAVSPAPPRPHREDSHCVSQGSSTAGNGLTAASSECVM